MSSNVVRLPVDAWGDRCGGSFRVRTDLADGLASALVGIWDRGGVVTSSGSLRAVNAPVTPARNPVSLHYLGRAIDLCLWSGMQQPGDPYLIRRDGAATDDPPRWRVFCAGDGAAGEEETLDGLLWHRGQGFVPYRRTGSFIDVTALFGRWSWVPIAARPAWRMDYVALEWWHFECHEGLVPGQTTFGEELRAVWSDAEIAGSPLGGVVDCVWNGQRFVAAG